MRLAGCLLAAVLACSGGQVLAGPHDGAPALANARGSVMTVRIGQAVVPLTGPWKFHVGDNPRWADPDFDDSGWENVDLTPKGATDYLFGMSEFVPGWTALGYSDHAGFAWYRLKVEIEHSDTLLSLLMPDFIDDGYQVYANGREVGHFGDLTRRRPLMYFTTAEWFPLPEAAPGESTALAVRFYMDPGTLSQPDAGGMHGPPRIGASGVIAAFGELARQRDQRAYASYLFEVIVHFGFAFALLALYCLDRSEKVYLWFLFAYVAEGFRELYSFTTVAVARMPVETQDAGYLLGSCFTAFLITGWWHWFQLQQKRWLIRMVWIAVLIGTLAQVCVVPPLLGSLAPYEWAPCLQAIVNIAQLAVGLLFAVIVVYGIRRLGREGWLMLPAVLLFSVSLFRAELARLHVPVAWTPFGVRISLLQIADIALAAVLGLLIIRRFQRSQRRKQQLEADLRQAQQVQRVLLPQEIPQMAGFRIECEYRPAQEVGGDFFQVLEMGRSLDRGQRASDTLFARDGGVLVVIGDVSGKGVHAAMVVALIIGTLRTVAEETEEPRIILQRLNRRLVGRMEGGFATCLCARIAPDGSLSVANAGHLAPWLDGKEVEVPRDLPLGIAEGIEYAASHLKIPENGTLTFVSDGVVEAKNGNKELFGFDRVRAISTQPASQIADAAKQFGQEDDITVVTIQRVPVVAYA